MRALSRTPSTLTMSLIRVVPACALLNEALAAEEGLEDGSPAEDLLSLEGMDEATAYVLASRGVRTRDDLAELAVDEITDIEDMDETRAAALIMEARKHWFE